MVRAKAAKPKEKPNQKPSQKAKSDKPQIGKGLPGPGRPKGSKDKIPQQVAEMVAEALTEVGGVQYFIDKAETEPKAFMALCGKLMPKDVNLTMTVDNATLEILQQRRSQLAERREKIIEHRQQAAE